MTQQDLAHCVGVSRPAVTQWETGEIKSIEGANLFKVAECLKVNFEWLVRGTGPMRSDAVNEEKSVYSTLEPGPDSGAYIPLFASWVEAERWIDAGGGMRADDAEEWLPCPHPHGPLTFATRVRGVSMEDEFKEGDIVYVDPECKADHKDFVVVRPTDTQEETLRQLIIEGGRKYLKAYNKSWLEPVSEVTDQAMMVGVVIGKYKKYK